MTTIPKLSALTSEEKRVMIAMIHGYKRWPFLNGVTRPDGQWVSRTEPFEDAIKLVAPNYYGSLDAIHEVEEMLDSDQWPKYVAALEKHGCCASWIKYMHFIHATATQRADALLIALGKAES